MVSIMIIHEIIDGVIRDPHYALKKDIGNSVDIQ